MFKVLMQYKIKEEVIYELVDMILRSTHQPLWWISGVRVPESYEANVFLLSVHWSGVGGRIADVALDRTCLQVGLTIMAYKYPDTLQSVVDGTACLVTRVHAANVLLQCCVFGFYRNSAEG